MPKFQALFDNDPYPVKKGDIVELKELVPGLEKKFRPYNGREPAVDPTENLDPAVIEDLTGNVDREGLKKKAIDLGIDYAPNITTPKLQALVDAKIAELTRKAEGDDTVEGADA